MFKLFNWFMPQPKTPAQLRTEHMYEAEMMLLSAQHAAEYHNAIAKAMQDRIQRLGEVV